MTETKPSDPTIEKLSDHEGFESSDQPANRGAGDTSPPEGHEFEGGSRGAHSGVNVEQSKKVSGTP